MKKIIFVGQSLRIGGAQRALLNQLNDLDTNKYEVSLLLYSQTGEYLSSLNKNIKLVKSNYILNCIGKTSMESKKSLSCFLIRNSFAVCAKIFGSQRVFNLIFKFSRKLRGYDYAVSYLHNINNNSLYFGYNKFILDKIDANKKVAWIHSDYEIANLNNKYNNGEYHRMDYVINVSNTMKKKFDDIVNLDNNKSKVIYNILPEEEIRLMSQSYKSKLQKDFFNIVTVCRMDSNKSVKELCEVAKELHKKGYKFKWSFIGSGPLLNECREFVLENQLNDKINFYGFVENPYPIIKQANLLVSGSKSETFGMSIVESLILNTPVVALYYPAITEIITNSQNGIIASDFQDMLKNIEILISDKNSYMKIKENTGLMIDYSKENRMEINEIFK